MADQNDNVQEIFETHNGQKYLRSRIEKNPDGTETESLFRPDGTSEKRIDYADANDGQTDGAKRQRVETNYDSKGEVENRSFFEKDGKLTSRNSYATGTDGKPYVRYNDMYNDDGSMTTTVFRQSGMPLSKAEYVNAQEAMKDPNAAERETTSYDAQGNAWKVTNYGKGGVKLSAEEYEYPQNGTPFLSLEIVYGSNGSEVATAYKPDGLRKSRTEYLEPYDPNKTDDLRKRVETLYDANNSAEKVNKYGENGVLEKTVDPKDIQSMASELQKITGESFEFKMAHESGLGIDNLRAPHTDEMQKKLEAENVQFSIADKNGQKLIYIETDKPLRAQKDNVKEYSDELKKITGIDWEFKSEKDSGLGVNNLRVPFTDDLQEKLTNEKVQFKIAEKNGQKLIYVETDKPLRLPPQQQQQQYQDGFKEYAARYDAAMAAPNANQDEVSKTYANESQEFFIVAQKRAYDEALLKSVHENYFGTNGKPGRKSEIEGKDPATLPPADQMLQMMVSKYGLTDDLSKRTNDLPIDLRDYPEPVREGYVSQMNALLSSYVPNHQPMTTEEVIRTIDVVEGRAPTMEPQNDNEIENNTPQDLLKEAEDMKAWVSAYNNESKSAEPPYENPYANIVGVKRIGDRPDSPVHMQLETGSTIVNSSKSLHLSHTDGGPSFEECMTMVRMGQKKGWTVAKLSGSEEFKAKMFLACRALNMPVKDYQPSTELQVEAEKMLAQMPRPTYAERAADLDSRMQGGVYVPPRQQQQPEPPQPEPTPTPVDNAQLKTSFENVDKVMADAMDFIAVDEQTKVGLALKEAIDNQRKEWRKELKAVEAKEAKGEALTPEETAMKAKAAKYQVMSDVRKEPKNPPAISQKDMDPTIRKAYQTERRNIQADSLLTAAVAQELCAKTKDGMVEGKLDMSTPMKLNDLMQETTRITAEKKAELPKGMAAIMRETGNIAASAKNIFAQATVKYQQKTNEAPTQAQALSKNAQKLDARLATVIQRQGR